MQVRINRKKYNVYAFDIETHNDEESIKKRETSMWLGCLIDENNKIDDEASYLYSMEEVFNKLEALSNPKRKHGEKKKPCKNIVVYVYNLSFEWSFMVPYMLENGFTFKAIIEDDDEYVFNTISTHSVSSVWNINIKFSANSGNIIFRDLAKIYGGGLRNVAQAFNLPTQKGEIDYRLNRLHNHIVTKEEKEYCFKDTRIIIDILSIMQAKGDRYFFNSMSMASYSMRMMIKYGWPRTTKPYAKYRELYPELKEEETAFLRNAVSGGITYAPERWQFKDIKHDIICIDKNSMHPSSAYFNKFAWGYGEYKTGRPFDYANYSNCCHVRVSYAGVKLHSVIKLIGIPYVDDFELTLWDFEIETMKKCYDNLEIEYIDYYRYRKKPLIWRRYYAHCYYARLEAKERGDDFNVLYYKLLMNSSYGKSLEKAHISIFENYIDDDGIITSKTINKNKPSYLNDEEWNSKMINAKYTYLPYGSQIPAYSRCDLIETALKISPDGSKIVYFDTDSIFFIKDDETMANFEKYVNKRNFLGGWKIDKVIERAQFTAPKRYKYKDSKGTHIKAGGINFTKYISDRAKEKGITEIEDINKFINDYQFEYNEVNIVSSIWQVQRAYRVRGGTIIEFQDKEMSVPKKYKEIFENNFENE
ncbi:MAG: hypothetical protein J6S67_05415 [Methanobrevibacter sp.]|nr:hypothetical protein [Methanobrevibacter sp.]